MSEARLRLDRDKAEAEVVALRRQRDELVAEVSRLRALFDDAGQGEHNVLALVDHYQHESIEAADRLRATCRQRDELEAALLSRLKKYDELLDTCNELTVALRGVVASFETGEIGHLDGDAVPSMDRARAVLAKWGAP